jgi:hypothetical protein
VNGSLRRVANTGGSRAQDVPQEVMHVSKNCAQKRTLRLTISTLGEVAVCEMRDVTKLAVKQWQRHGLFSKVLNIKVCEVGELLDGEC